VNIMSREIRNMGLKHAFYRSGGVLKDSLLSSVALSAADSSSFNFVERGRYDQISFRQARLDAAGAPLGVDTVTYQVDSTRQMLRRKLNNAAFEDFCPGIDALQFQYGLYAQKLVTINERPPPAANWSRLGLVNTAFSPTRMVVSLAASGSGSVRNDFVTFSTTASRTYYVEVSAAGDANFFNNGGVMEAQILSSGGAVLQREPFLPGRSMTTRTINITAPTAAGCKLALYLRATGAASVRVGMVRFGQADLGSYTWRDAPTLAEKKAIRAVRILLMAKAQGQGAAKPASTYVIGDAVVGVTDTQLRRYYEEEIPVSNNGLF
jgi:hypothetical protein